MSANIACSRPSRHAESVRARAAAPAPSALAVTKIFTSASGQMTVPMSRPSSTAPPGRAAKARCASISAARTPGIAATTEAASAIWRVRSVASSKSVRPSPRAAATAAASS